MGIFVDVFTMPDQLLEKPVIDATNSESILANLTDDTEYTFGSPSTRRKVAVSYCAEHLDRRSFRRRLNV